MAGPRGDRARARAARRRGTVRTRMTEQPYFDDSGEPSDAAPRFVRPTEDVAPLDSSPACASSPSPRTP